ncbi:MAG: hypothetical protein J6I40_01590 [Mailhella sp.]|nr:hypothetical protein [Mailhella sp.]
MLKWLASFFMACGVLLPSAAPADDLDPLDMFAVVAADDIKNNERMFQDATSAFNMMGENIMRSNFTSACSKMTSIKYLANLSSFKELDPDRKNFAKPAVVRYDNMADHMAEFLFKVGKHVTTNEFKNAKSNVAWFKIRDAQGIVELCRHEVEKHRKVSNIAVRIKKDFDEIASQKGAPTPKLLSESNAMKKYFKYNPKMWPLKKGNLRKMDIPAIYGLHDVYTADMAMQSKARDDIKKLDEIAKKLSGIMKNIEYLQASYRTWRDFLSRGQQYRQKVREIAVHPKAKAYFMPEFIAALTTSFQKNATYYEMLDKEIGRGETEVIEMKRYVSQEPVRSLLIGGEMNKHIFKSGNANNLADPYLYFQTWVENDLCSKACK